MQPTSERLAKALEELHDPTLAYIIARVRAKYYDEFEGPLDTPLVTLVGELREAGHGAFAQRVIGGEFDASAEESEAWFEREGKPLLAALEQESAAKQSAAHEPDRRYFAPHADDEYFDEVVIRTVPRYKTSGLSGDEWRVSAVIELKRKGMVLFDRGFGTLAAATAFLPGIFISAREVPIDVMHEERARPLCMQPGCAERAVTVYRKKVVYDRSGHSHEPMTGGEYLRFCRRHARRGDCGLEDSDANYEVVSGPGPDGAAGYEGDVHEAAVVRVPINNLDDVPGAIKKAVDDFRSGQDAGSRTGPAAQKL